MEDQKNTPFNVEEALKQRAIQQRFGHILNGENKEEISRLLNNEDHVEFKTKGDIRVQFNIPKGNIKEDKRVDIKNYDQHKDITKKSIDIERKLLNWISTPPEKKINEPLSPPSFELKRPDCNIILDEDHITYEFMMAGVPKEDIQLNIVNDMLRLSTFPVGSEKKTHNTVDNVVDRQFSIPSYKGAYNLHENFIEIGSIDAKHENGILKVKFKILDKKNNGLNIKIG